MLLPGFQILPFLSVSYTHLALFKQTNTDWIEIDFSRWGACVQKESEIFSLLKTSVLKRQEIIFCYYNSKGCLLYTSHHHT